MRGSLEERFWAKVRVGSPDECWEWTASKAGNYGHIGISGRKNKMEYAHRISWELFRGIIPENSSVLHICDNPSCVNPNHLFLGTQEDNMHDMARKGRAAKMIGERHGRAKLTENEVLLIRKEYAVDNITQIRLAKKFNVSERLISAIVNHELWKHI